jgi:rhodanese-related sulfurtransferase
MSAPTRRYHIPSAVRRSSLRISPAEAHRLLEKGAVLVDVRRHEDDSAELPNALRIPPDEIPGRLDDLPREGAIVLACT